MGILDPVPERVALFPLPDHVLLPHLPTAYRIFEPRYRQLVEDLRKAPPEARWIAVPRLGPGWEAGYHHNPDFLPIAAVGLVRRIVDAPGGEFHIVIEGRHRCRLSEVPSLTSYRFAHAEPCPDLPEADFSPDKALISLIAAVTALGGRVPLPEGLLTPTPGGDEVGRILDRLAGVLLSLPDQRQSWLECRILSQRMQILRSVIQERAAEQGPGARPGRWRPSIN